jgi:hypothetical protein
MAEDLFTITFWQATAARMVNYAAACALSAWGLGATGSAAGGGLSIPGWGVAVGAGNGALLGLLIALAGSQLSAQTAGKLAATLPAPGDVVEVRSAPAKPRPKRAPRKMPSAAAAHPEAAIQAAKQEAPHEAP